MSNKQSNVLPASFLTNIDKYLDDVGFLKTVRARTGIRPSQLFLLAVGIVLVLSLLSIFADLLTNLFGMLYPAYMSWKAIERKNEEQKKVWLTYWIVFGSLSSIDDTFGFILDFVPGFYTLRFVVYVWLFYPRANNGATVIYTALKPLLVKVRAEIDGLNSKASVKRA